MKPGIKLLLGWVFFTLILILVSNSLVSNWSRIIEADARGYYQWLTAVFIQHNPLDQPYSFPLPNGLLFNRYTYGVALMILPFFLVVHWISLLFHLPSDGYAALYGSAIVLAAVTYCYLGLYLIYRILSRHFGKTVVWITLGVIFLGSNLFYYTVGQAGMSHIYSFFLFACIIYLTPRFIANPGLQNSFFIAIPLALGVLIRPTNLAMGLFLIFYDVGSFNDLKQRIRLFIHNPLSVIVLALTGFVCWIPQMFYWHATTGDWIVYSYKYSWTGPETFAYWKEPRIFRVLFGVRSGWLLYSPLMVLSLAGLILLIIKRRLHVWGILIIFTIILYLNSSWWVYTFPCGFGYRSFIEYYPLLCIPLAMMIEKITSGRGRLKISILMCLLIFFIFANIRMSYIYHHHPCWDGKLWGMKEYKMIWGKTLYLDNPEENFPPYQDYND
jgi:hypothetical protein